MATQIKESLHDVSRLPEMIIQIQEIKHICSCFGIILVNTEQKALRFYQKVKYMVAQFAAILIIISLINLYFDITNGIPAPKDSESKTSAYFWTGILRSISAQLAMYYMQLYSSHLNTVPELSQHKIARKILMIQLGTMIPNLQSGIINIFASSGLISGGDKYPAYMLGIYTNSILVCSEMVALGFLAHFLYPIDHFDFEDSLIFDKVED